MVATPFIARGAVRSQLCGPVDGINHNGDPIDDRSVAAPPDPQSHAHPLITLSRPPASAPPNPSPGDCIHVSSYGCGVALEARLPWRLGGNRWQRGPRGNARKMFLPPILVNFFARVIYVIFQPHRRSRVFNRSSAIIPTLLIPPAGCSDDSSPLLTGRPLPSNG